MSGDIFVKRGVIIDRIPIRAQGSICRNKTTLPVTRRREMGKHGFLRLSNYACTERGQDMSQGNIGQAWYRPNQWNHAFGISA